MRSGRRIIYQPSIPNEIYDGINIEKVQVFVWARNRVHYLSKKFTAPSSI